MDTTLELEVPVSLSALEEKELAARTIMGWQRIRALAAAGMDVQSHTHEHMVINTLTPERATRDLRRSWRVLREELGVDAHTVAYPVGCEIGPEHRRAVVAAGFELGFTNATGVCSLDHLDRLGVPRVSMDLTLGGALYKLRLLLARRSRTRRRPSGDVEGS